MLFLLEIWFEILDEHLSHCYQILELNSVRLLFEFLLKFDNILNIVYFSILMCQGLIVTISLKILTISFRQYIEFSISYINVMAVPNRSGGN
jgi:hypothetical protein